MIYRDRPIHDWLHAWCLTCMLTNSAATGDQIQFITTSTPCMGCSSG